jgi:hypothetical protein
MKEKETRSLQYCISNIKYEELMLDGNVTFR